MNCAEDSKTSEDLVGVAAVSRQHPAGDERGHSLVKRDQLLRYYSAFGRVGFQYGIGVLAFEDVGYFLA